MKVWFEGEEHYVYARILTIICLWIGKVLKVNVIKLLDKVVNSIRLRVYKKELKGRPDVDIVVDVLNLTLFSFVVPINVVSSINIKSWAIFVGVTLQAP